jgi:hypothetical protein
MCRDKLHGGRRCNGKHGSSGSSVVGSAPVSSNVPYGPEKPPPHPFTREHVQQLAAKIPKDRRDAFGKKLTAKDRRFFAVREAGWTGPIDQDGYPVHSDEPWPKYRGKGKPRSGVEDSDTTKPGNPWPKPTWTMTPTQKADHDYDQPAFVGLSDTGQRMRGYLKDKLAGRS